jgi:hypothetical protein
MGIYWRLKSVPELKGLDSQRRIELFNKVKGHLLFTRVAWFCVFFFLISLYPILDSMWHWKPPNFRLNWILLACSFLWIGLFFPALIAKARPHMKRILEGCCPNCGYDLRATPNRCPECGTIVHSGAQQLL